MRVLLSTQLSAKKKLISQPGYNKKADFVCMQTLSWCASNQHLFNAPRSHWEEEGTVELFETTDIFQPSLWQPGISNIFLPKKSLIFHLCLQERPPIRGEKRGELSGTWPLGGAMEASNNQV